MVLLGVDGEEDLYDWGKHLSCFDVPYQIFREPDIDQFTAMAVHPGVDPKMFRDLCLL
jgi:hypothetical protein